VLSPHCEAYRAYWIQSPIDNICLPCGSSGASGLGILQARPSFQLSQVPIRQTEAAIIKQGSNVPPIPS